MSSADPTPAATPTFSPTLGVVVLAYGEEPLLGACLDAILDSRTRDGGSLAPRLVVVDNGFTSTDAQRLRADARITWLEPGRNTGFTGGANLGAAALETDVVAFVNSDAIVTSTALVTLVEGLADPQVGLVSGRVVLFDDPAVINTVGNPVHYSMLSWAGGWGDAANLHDTPQDIASATGALLAIRTPQWQELGGFHEVLFAYGEDVELSLRTWLSGLVVRYLPDAVAAHHYEFSRNPRKFYLLERNRLFNLLTLFECGTLRLLAPPLLLVELGITAAAVAGGWFPQKWAGWVWLWQHRTQVAQRRALVQSARKLPDSAIVGMLSDTVTPAPGAGVAVPGAVNTLLGGYGRWARRRMQREIR